MLLVADAFCAGGASSNVVDIFDASSGRWSTAALSAARTNIAATSLPSQGFPLSISPLSPSPTTLPPSSYNAVTMIYYTDSACANQASNPFLGVSNPLVAILNSCTRSITFGSVTSYLKFTLCSSSNVSWTNYLDSLCATPQPPSHSNTPNMCIRSLDTPFGSYKISCPAPPRPLAIFAGGISGL